MYGRFYLQIYTNLQGNCQQYSNTEQTNTELRGRVDDSVGVIEYTEDLQF